DLLLETGERIEKCRLARVRVAGKRDREIGFSGGVVHQPLDADLDGVGLASSHGEAVTANTDLDGITEWSGLYYFQSPAGDHPHFHQTAADAAVIADRDDAGRVPGHQGS